MSPWYQPISSLIHASHPRNAHSNQSSRTASTVVQVTQPNALFVLLTSFCFRLRKSNRCEETQSTYCRRIRREPNPRFLPNMASDTPSDHWGAARLFCSNSAAPPMIGEQVSPWKIGGRVPGRGDSGIFMQTSWCAHCVLLPQGRGALAC